MLKDLYVMKVDAKQELDNMNSLNDINRFKSQIMVPDGIDLEYLLKGDRYFLTGGKGSGKTALLIYTALKAEELYNAERGFIIFKEFTQEEREDYTKLAHVIKYDQTAIKPYLDYEYVWWWLFHSTIADIIQTSPKVIFEYNEDLEIYLEAVNAIKTYPRGSGKKMPVMSKDGYVEASLDVPIKSTNVKLSARLNFQPNSKNPKEIRFSTHIEQLNKFYASLKAGDSPLYIIVDELNLSKESPDEYNRDILMIRDMIVAIERFNAISKNRHNVVRILGSVRNEVINSVRSTGKEINKSIESYGIPIDWTLYDQEGLQHPLIKLLINYFRVSDSSCGGTPHLDNAKEYYRWVDKEIDGYPSEEVIRNNTLYRPRHIVRLLNLLKTLCGNFPKISSAAISRIEREYSKECWNEITEELSLSYTPKELELIKEWLTGIPGRTNYATLRNKAEELWTGENHLDNLMEKFDDIIRDLYYFGVIGNYIDLSSGTTQRWYFRGDETILKNQDIVIHRVFCPVLSTTPLHS